jgi:Ca2+-binding EF-hand superfamily protein
MMRALNYKPTEEEIASITDRVQKDHDSKMIFQIFLQIMAPRIIKANEVYADDKIQAAFERFDKDRDGVITASELRIALQDGFCPGMKKVAEALTDEDIAEVMNEADLNGDGVISYSEFKEIIPHLCEGLHTSVKIK